MKLFTAALMTLGGLVVANAVSCAYAQQGNSFTGTVQRVWEDGFRLETGDRTLRVDTWNLCGDFTARHISTDDRLTVTGEFDGGEFDAFSLTDSDGNAICSADGNASAQQGTASTGTVQQGWENGNSFTGTVQRVWEDGFQLNTGDRTLRVDAWNLCGDFTARHVGVDNRLTVTGEFDGGEFDAFSIADNDGNAICQ